MAPVCVLGAGSAQDGPGALVADDEVPFAGEMPFGVVEVLAVVGEVIGVEDHDGACGPGSADALASEVMFLVAEPIKVDDNYRSTTRSVPGCVGELLGEVFKLDLRVRHCLDVHDGNSGVVRDESR